MRRIGKAGELVLGRDLGHRHRALGERRDVAGDIVGRDHRGAAADEHAQADVVALGAVGRIDRAFAHADSSDIERTATASAASAPARRAAVTRRSARSVSADWSSNEEEDMRGF